MTSADITALSMRTFLASEADEPLNPNRLRFSDRKLGDEMEIKSFLPNGHRTSMGLLHSPAAVSKAFGFGGNFIFTRITYS